MKTSDKETPVGCLHVNVLSVNFKHTQKYCC